MRSDVAHDDDLLYTYLVEFSSQARSTAGDLFSRSWAIARRRTEHCRGKHDIISNTAGHEGPKDVSLRPYELPADKPFTLARSFAHESQFGSRRDR